MRFSARNDCHLCMLLNRGFRLSRRQLRAGRGAVNGARGFVMKISMDILAHELRSFIDRTSFHPNLPLTIDRYELLDDSVTDFSLGCVELLDCNLHEPKLDMLPDGANVICMSDMPRDAPCLADKRLNFILLCGISTSQAINRIIQIFHKYEELDRQLNQAFVGSSSLQSVVDVATEMIGSAICMLDMNHRVLAMSQDNAPVNDALWDSMEDGYGYQHYDIVSKSLPKLAQMDVDGQDVFDGLSNITNRHIRVYLLRRGSKGVATFGLHKLSDLYAPFDAYQVQLADYIVAKLTSHLSMFTEIQAGRGKAYEQLILDLLDGKRYEEGEIEALAREVSIATGYSYQLGFIISNRTTERTEHSFALMEYIENIIPDSECVLYGDKIIFLRALSADQQRSGEINGRFTNYLNSQDCFCLISNPFKSLSSIGAVKNLLLAIIPYVEADGAPEPRVYNYCEYAELHALGLLAEKIPLPMACSPAIVQLREYDQENKTSYYDTLVTYLRRNCNVSETAADMHMHRNSLLYRIGKIEKIVGRTIDDEKFQAEARFTIACIEYHEKYARSE